MAIDIYRSSLRYIDVIMSAMASVKSPASWLFTQLFVQVQIKAEIHVTGLCGGNPPVTGEFLWQRDSNAENVFIWWRHHGPHLKDWGYGGLDDLSFRT